ISPNFSNSLRFCSESLCSFFRVDSAAPEVPRGEVVCLWGNELNNFDSRGWFYMLLSAKL
ncbi:hypothetical protein HID58_045371, partial [Brassica napus]